MTPESIAKKLGLKYIGKNTLLEDCPVCGGTGWQDFDIIRNEVPIGCLSSKCMDGKIKVTLYQFTDFKTGTTIAVYELPELESKRDESRKKFKRR